MSGNGHENNGNGNGRNENGNGRNGNGNGNGRGNGNGNGRGNNLYLHGLKFDEIDKQLKAHDVSIEENEDIEKKKEIANKVPEYGENMNKTALEVAVDNTDEKAVKRLLELGADPNPQLDEEPPLYTAIEKDRIDIVRLLLEYGADVDATKKIGKDDISPLFLAAAKGYHKIIDVLLEKNPRLNDAVSSTANMEKNITPLVVAALEGHEDAVKSLKGAGSIPPELSQNDFQDFLLAAAHTKLLKRTQMLIEDFEYIKGALDYSGDPPGVNKYLDGEYSVFYNALSVTKNLHVVEYLHSKGAKLDSKPYGKDKKTEYQDLDPKLIEEYRRFILKIDTPERRSIFNNTNNNNSPPMRNANGPPPSDHSPLLTARRLPSRAERMRRVGVKRGRGSRKTRKGKARKARKLTRRG